MHTFAVSSEKARDADIRAYVGGSGNGKTSCLLHDLNALRAPRVLVWDYKHEFEINHCYRLGSLLDHVTKAGRRGAFAIAYRPDQGRREVRERDFDIFCRLAYEAGRSGGLVLVVEELHTVTYAHHAPEAWRLLTCTGRGEGIKIFGTSQRPAHMDKDFLGNCSTITSFRLPYHDDARNVSQSMPGTKADDLVNLPPLHGLRYVTGQGLSNLRVSFNPLTVQAA